MARGPWPMHGFIFETIWPSEGSLPGVPPTVAVFFFVSGVRLLVNMSKMATKMEPLAGLPFRMAMTGGA